MANKGVFNFPAGTGLQFDTSSFSGLNSTYTFVALFEFTDPVTKYHRIAEFKNLTDDHGLYVNPGSALEFFTGGTGPSNAFPGSAFAQVALTATAAAR